MLEERLTPRVGAGCAVMGTLGYLVLVIAHGDLPAEDARHTLEHVAGGAWPAIHLGSVLSVALMLVAVTALQHTLARHTRGDGAQLVRFGMPLLTVALAVFGVEFAIDGFALPLLAERLAGAGPEAEAAVLTQAQTVLTVMGGISMLTQALFGLAFAVIGLGTVRAVGFPTWLGWLGTVGGIGWFAVGAAMFTGVPGANFGLAVAFVNLVWAWLIGAGVVLWRWSARTPSSWAAHAAAGVG